MIDLDLADPQSECKGRVGVAAAEVFGVRGRAGAGRR